MKGCDRTEYDRAESRNLVKTRGKGFKVKDKIKVAE